MVRLYNKRTGKLIGHISDTELKFLIDKLVEETKTDTDYYLTPETLKYLQQKGISSGLLKLLEDAMGHEGELEIEYKVK